MSLLTTIDKVPLYDTMREALLWGKQYGITGYHIHYYNRIRGYMSGVSHEEITQKISRGVVNPLTSKELKSGDFEVTDTEKRLYNSLRPNSRVLNNTARTAPVARRAARTASIPAPATTPTPTPATPQQPSTPSYTPPSTGGGSSSGGGY
mgnify:CR=1 FL=1